MQNLINNRIIIDMKITNLNQGKMIKKFAPLAYGMDVFIINRKGDINLVLEQQPNFDDIVRFVIPYDEQQYNIIDKVNIINSMNFFQLNVYGHVENLLNECSINYMYEGLFNRVVDFVTRIDNNNKHINWYYNIYPKLDCSWDLFPQPLGAISVSSVHLEM